MSLQGKIECKSIAKAFEEAISPLGPEVRRLLVGYLEDEYSIPIGTSPCSSLEEIKRALVEVVGEGSVLIISRLRRPLVGS